MLIDEEFILKPLGSLNPLSRNHALVLTYGVKPGTLSPCEPEIARNGDWIATVQGHPPQVYLARCYSR